MASLTLVAVLVVVVIAGYTVPWIWTGFKGNRLWDWLELLALPVAVALVPVYRELRAKWTRWHTAVLVTGLVGFGVIVIGGCLDHWDWTGFRGNTLWDWLRLLLLPLLLPGFIVPALMPMAKHAAVEVEDGTRDHSVANLSPEAPRESTGARS